jgi:hypothetical protein
VRPGELVEVEQDLAGRNDERREMDRLTPAAGQVRTDPPSKGDVAIVGVEAGPAAGAATPFLRSARRSGATDLILCEGCGRILVWVGDEVGR